MSTNVASTWGQIGFAKAKTQLQLLVLYLSSLLLTSPLFLDFAHSIKIDSNILSNHYDGPARQNNIFCRHWIGTSMQPCLSHIKLCCEGKQFSTELCSSYQVSTMVLPDRISCCWNATSAHSILLKRLKNFLWQLSCHHLISCFKKRSCALSDT